MSGVTLWLIVGGFIGALASIVMGRDSTHGQLLECGIGIAGAMLGGWAVSPLLGAPGITSGRISPLALLVSFSCAIGLLALVNVLTRSRKE